ncbi:hypothetical protein CRG98_039078, partial [Punica granatum]
MGLGYLGGEPAARNIDVIICMRKLGNPTLRRPHNIEPRLVKAVYGLSRAKLAAVRKTTAEAQDEEATFALSRVYLPSLSLDCRLPIYSFASAAIAKPSELSSLVSGTLLHLIPSSLRKRKLQSDALREAISGIKNDSNEKKKKFVETIELQIGLKNYDPQKDKRFSGSVKLPHIPRPKMKVCMLGDAQHVEE